MKKKRRNILLSIFTCGLLTTAGFGMTLGVSAMADSARVKPTGAKTETLTQEIKDSDLDTFKVYGASIRTQGEIGFRFLSTIESSDLEIIPNTAEFGTILIPFSKLGDQELTVDTEKALVAPAKVDTDAEDVPEGGLGYYITLMGETLEKAFPEDLYGTVLAARAYVKYTYQANGQTITDYAYSEETLFRSMAYITSCELTTLEGEGKDVSISDYDYLNGIISKATEDAVLDLSATEIKTGEIATVDLIGAADSKNDFSYNLYSSNENIATINENGEIVGVSGGVATITANIGTTEFSADITVLGRKNPIELTDVNVLYSTQDGQIFLPDGVLDNEEETIVSAVGTQDGVDYFANKWNALALTETEINENAVRATWITLETSEGDCFIVKALSYAGVIDELSDFPAFFNNTAVPSEYDAATYPAVAPNVYGYYIVTKNLGDGTDTLALTQTEATDYQKTNGFNGVLDGAGHTLKFKLTSGGLVGMILGNAVIKNIAIIYEDGTYDSTTKKGGYGVFGYITNGAPEIRNSYIQRTNNLYHQGSVFGIMARPNAKLILKNTAVHGNNTSNTSGWYSNMWISAASTNAYLIYARAAATGWPNVTNFTEVSTTNALTNDLSTFDTDYWTTDGGKLTWKGLSDMTVSAYNRVYAPRIDGTVYYSTVNSELILPETFLPDGETIVDVKDEEGNDYYENGAWVNLALTSEEIASNAKKEGNLLIETASGNFYKIAFGSYAGVIDELSDFSAFFNNDPSATHAKTYGYYVVAKDLGTGAEELTFTQSATTDYKADCGFNGVLDGAGHTLKFKLMSGGLVGLFVGNGTIKNLGVIYADETTTQYGVFGYMTSGNPVIDNCYIERTNNKYQKWSVFGIMSRPNAKLTLHNTVVYGYNTSNECTMNSNMWISASSTNAYLIHGRANATSWVNVQNFTKVFNDGIENGSREVLLSEIADDSGFDNNYWSKENGKLIWKGIGAVTVTWSKEGETTQETVSAGSAVNVPNPGTDMCWATNKDGSGAISGKNIYPTQSVIYYARSAIKDMEDVVYFSTANNEIVLPESAEFSANNITTITSKDGSVTYYANGVWENSLGLTAEQLAANETSEADIKIKAGSFIYYATVQSYAGVIDELSDFATFFNNDPSATAPNVYGYYIITKDLGTGVEELALTQSTTTDYKANNGFNGVLDGQGHTLRFKLMSGGLVGQILGNATIKNLGVIYEDATSTYYGAFGYMTNGNPVIDNCYIERTNNHYQAWSVFGIMSRPNAKLILRNTVVYGYNVSNNCAKNTNMWINETSTNAYLIHARANAMDWVNVQGFTKVFNDAIENGSREVLLSEIADNSGFNSEYWYKANGKLIWKGFETVNISWVDGEKTTIEPVTKGSAVPIPEQEGTEYWSSNEEGSDIINGSVRRIDEDVSFYKFHLNIDVQEKAMYSTMDGEFFLPDEVSSWNNVEYIIGVDENGESNGVTYYEDGVWRRNFGLTGEQINANEVVETEVKIYDGTYYYNVTVASYAGVIDELSDFPKFFNNDPNATHAKTYGYYIVTKDLGTDAEELTFTQSTTTDYKADCGFNGLLDGAGHTLKFKLMSGGLVGLFVGNGTIKNLSVIYADETSTQYGVFGYMTSGNPVIDNCYIERTNNKYQKWSVFGIMSRPNAKLELHNTVVYGYNISNECAMNSNMWISASSTNAYLIHARANATSWVNVQGFTKVFNDGVENGAREVALSEIVDASTFNECWSKENEKLTWKGADDMAVSSIGALELEPYKLVENGATEYAIVLPDNADETLTLAGQELASFFAEATGATLNVVSDGAYSDYDAIISIGDTKAFAASGVTMGEMTSEGYHIERKDNAIYLNANTSRGCLYGVYGLLGELFEYEQYSADCYTILNRPTVELYTIEVTENPDIAIRMPSNGAIINDSTLAGRFGMKMGETDVFFNAGDYTNNKGETGNEGWRVWHNALEILPVTYWTAQGKTNWFSNNKVNGAINQLCYTARGNADDYTAMVDQIVVIMAQTLTSSQITSRPDALYVTLTSEDGGGVCTCSACTEAKALYGSDAGAVIKLCNDVREGMDEWMEANPRYKREVTLLFFAYNDYVTAPTAGTIEMREDVGVMYAVSDYVNYYYDVYNTENDAFRAQFEAWSNLCAINNSTFALWTYTKNFSAYMLRADVYGENAFFNENAYRYFAENGVDLWFNQGATNGTTTLSAFEKLNGYIDSQMMWDSNQSVEDLIDKWFNAMYGSAASYMRALYNGQNQKAREAFGTTKKGIPSVGVSESAMKNTLTNSVLQTWFGYIDSAKNAINSDSSLTNEQKAVYLERINEEWISVEFWYVSLYYSSFWDGVDGVTVDTDAATAAFRDALGYDESTGTYAKDVVLLEKGKSTLVQWIESGFTSDI
ncbi:MAG: DUF4838 domain-containing protein [Clostridia bacterium]|nr:DUF4838 domain-containing protein [Clostridia bacterium]